MTAPSRTPAAQFLSCTNTEKQVLLLFALYGEPLGKTRLLTYVREAHIDNEGRAFNAASLADTVSHLRTRGLLEDATGTGAYCAPAIVDEVLRAGFDMGVFESFCQVIESDQPAANPWAKVPAVRNFRNGVARLRMALLRGQPPAKVYPWFDACEMFSDPTRSTPFVEACGKPFSPDLYARLHPTLQDEAMVHLLYHTLEDPASAASLHQWLAQHPPHDRESMLVRVLAEHWLACGRLDEAEKLVAGSPHGFAQMVGASVLQLRGDNAAALPLFESGIKAVRRETGKRNMTVGGLPGVLYLLAMMRSSDPKQRKQAETWLGLALRNASRIDYHMLAALDVLHRVQSGVLPPDAACELPIGKWPLAQLFHALLLYWLGQPQPDFARRALADVAAQTEAAGLHFIAAQAAGVLGRLGDAEQAARAATLRARHGFSDLADWFERQETWRRQLSALVSLQAAAAPAEKKAESEARLIWLVQVEPRYGFITVEPREQKRDARGNWTKGRPVALKRLHGADRPVCVTEQDMRVCAAIRVLSYYDGVRYEIDSEKALTALVGHPLVFRHDQPDVKIDVLASAPQLLVTEKAGEVLLSLQPPVEPDGRDVVVSQETPTRLRVLRINPEHRRIAAVVGNGLTVPPQGKQEVLQAIGAVSSLITVQSEIGGASTQAEQVPADSRPHVHLLPFEAGLRMQVLVQPFAGGGPCYAPGQGTENVLADVGGKPLQARRDLAAERAAAQRLIDACTILAEAEHAHGEWLLPEPQQSLELLLQLQAHLEDKVIAWPEGEKFRVGAVRAASDMRLSVKSERDWFAAGGELRVDADTVLDLRQLLERVPQGRGRFVPLGDNRFLALTEEFHRRLSELATFGQPAGDGVRVHPLASFALEELAGEAGTFKADKKWKEHLARLRELDAYDPQLPGTLQAELRDYQHAGFHWLARLAHWGVGACLADDMGLGKTVQTLALLLLRAPQGPALVVAPTSVCTNWIAEATRFAPTLRATLFGAGERSLTGLQAFDVVVVSYGLLQQEAELFAGVQWHTVVLDEAQAIKNAATKRSQAVMALNADCRMVVTGTPLENHLGELWNLFRFINPGLLGSLEQFNQRFAQPIERQQDAKARAALRRLIRPFILRRTKTGVLAELPSRTEILREIDLSAEEAALYQALRQSALAKLEQNDAPAGQKSLQILAEIMKLRRACCNPQLVAPELGLSSSKLAAFGELLDELLENRHKALVFSQFVDHLGLIRAYLDQRGVRYQYLDGATPMQERKKRVDAFQAGDGDLFLISLKAGGTGLNLTAADYVIHMDPWWNPAVEDQASDRAHRMGQQRPVTIYRLVARDTIEKTIVDLHTHKRDLADSLLEGSDAAGKMSAQDMLRLLQEG